MCTTVRRHLVCKVIEINGSPQGRPAPQLYVCRSQDRRHKQEGFFCRLKASVYAKIQDRLYLIHFGHSLKIYSKPAEITQDKITN